MILENGNSKSNLAMLRKIRFMMKGIYSLAQLEFSSYSLFAPNSSSFSNLANSNWKWPAIPGIEKFENKTHSAAWNEDMDFENKTVGIIGNGSSAVQIIPTIFPSKPVHSTDD